MAEFGWGPLPTRPLLVFVLTVNGRWYVNLFLHDNLHLAFLSRRYYFTYVKFYTNPSYKGVFVPAEVGIRYNFIKSGTQLTVIFLTIFYSISRFA